MRYVFQCSTSTVTAQRCHLSLKFLKKSSEFDVEASDHALALIGLNVSAQFKSMIGLQQC